SVKFEDLRPGEGYDPRKEADNFGPVWKGGEWHIRNITDYMTTAAFALMDHAATNREEWLTRFYQIGKDAVRVRKDGELFAYVLPLDKPRPGEMIPDNYFRRQELLQILERGGVETEEVGNFQIE